jgi:hypothetical protein
MTAQRTEITKSGVTLTIHTPPVDEPRVLALESRFGSRLPEDYREFLLAFNGGKPVPACFQFTSKSGRTSDSVVNWFLSLSHEEMLNIEAVLGWLDSRIPPDVVPIAIDPFGNFILLGLRGDVRGKVYFWDHDREPERQPDWSNIDLIADSFDGFLRALTPD